MSTGYSIIEMGRDAGGALYSWLISLCCSVSCTTTNIVIGKRNLKVVRQLAEGGFSFVYLVEGSGEKFALKKVLSQLPEQAVAAKWEIEVHTAIKHVNCMPLVDHCVVPEFRLLMPLYPNGTLLDKALQLMERNERMPERQALLIFQQILHGVAAFHEHDPPWAHRDIKPANVLLGEDDVPVLMDFGSVQPARHKIKSRTEVRAAASQHSSTAFTPLFLLYPFLSHVSRLSPPTHAHRPYCSRRMPPRTARCPTAHPSSLTSLPMRPSTSGPMSSP